MSLMTDKELLEEVRTRFDLNLVELAAFLGVTPSVISEARRENNPRALSTVARLRAYDRLGYLWARDTLVNMFPDKWKEHLIAADNLRSKKTAAEEAAVKDADQHDLVL